MFGLKVGDIIEYSVRRGHGRGHINTKRGIVVYHEKSNRNMIKLFNHNEIYAKIYPGIVDFKILGHDYGVEQ